MKHLYSKHIFHAKRHWIIISLLSMTAFFSGLFIIIYIPYSCYLIEGRYSPYSCCASVMAQEKGQQISEAVPLPFGNTCHISIAAHDERYYYISVQKNSSLKILSGASSIRINFYNDKGKYITIPQKNESYHFEKILQTSVSSGSRIFIKFTNISTKTVELKAKYQKETEDIKKKIKHTTPKPKKVSSSNKKKKHTSQAKINSAQTTYSSPPPTVTKMKGSLSVIPHFIRLTPGTKRKLSISINNVPVFLADCHYLITEPSLLSVHNNTITAKKEGTTILYFRTKQSDVCGSCLIRILKI